MPHEHRRIDGQARKAQDEYLRRCSLTYLECCISLMLTHMSLEDVARVLERQAALLREHG